MLHADESWVQVCDLLGQRQGERLWLARLNQWRKFHRWLK